MFLAQKPINGKRICSLGKMEKFSTEAVKAILADMPDALKLGLLGESQTSRLTFGVVLKAASLRKGKKF